MRRRTMEEVAAELQLVAVDMVGELRERIAVLEQRERQLAAELQQLREEREDP